MKSNLPNRRVSAIQKTAAVRWCIDRIAPQPAGELIRVRLAVYILELHIPESSSLKRKRQVIRSLVKRLRNRFNVSAAEIGCQNLWQRSDLAVAAVCQNSGSADRLMEQLLSFIEQENRVNIISSKKDIY